MTPMDFNSLLQPNTQVDACLFLKPLYQFTSLYEASLPPRKPKIEKKKDSRHHDLDLTCTKKPTLSSDTVCKTPSVNHPITSTRQNIFRSRPKALTHSLPCRSDQPSSNLLSKNLGNLCRLSPPLLFSAFTVCCCNSFFFVSCAAFCCVKMTLNTPSQPCADAVAAAASASADALVNETMPMPPTGLSLVEGGCSGSGNSVSPSCSLQNSPKTSLDQGKLQCSVSTTTTTYWNPPPNIISQTNAATNNTATPFPHFCILGAHIVDILSLH
ncbi:hypothetical protein BD289DRAFT_181862 [Coniella lustricola]|uniref:Uncharacterized protein n=1 Tax=Coniella lustricola TaxID=2025994 RepID=A0A2T3ADG9_9PEZI|nr:hypothetical protein BD289DRAFT_181862 [Coniella lustricola]